MMNSNIHTSAKIHATAVISESVIIQEGVEIGPFCVLQDQVVLKQNVKLHSHVCISGNTEIGAGTEIFPFAAIGFKPQDLKYNGEASKIIVGENNSIREYTTIHPGTKLGTMETIIGNSCLLMVNSHVAHDCVVGNNVIMANNVALAGHVVLEDRVILGGLSAVHQFVRIGKHSIIGGVTAVREDVPPYSVVTGATGKLKGINRVGMKRHHFSRTQIAEVADIFNKIFFLEKDLEYEERVLAVKELYGDNVAVQDIIAFLSSRGQRAVCMP